MASYQVGNPGALTDAQARNLVIRALRRARQVYRTSSTLGERYERELDRMIKRKTRINASSMNTMLSMYRQYNIAAEAAMAPLSDAINAATQF